jgi:hypothetical protein
MTLGMMILVALALLVLLLGFVTLNRYIAYKERVALAQLGFLVEELTQDVSGKRGNKGVLWGGVITGMSGLALLLGLATLGTGAWLLAGLLPLFVGLGMVIIYFMTFASTPDKQQEPEQDEQPDLLSDLESELEKEVPSPDPHTR